MEIFKTFIKKYKLLFGIAVSCVFFEALCDLLQPTIMARIIDEGIKFNDINKILNYGVLMLITALLGACFAIARNIISSSVSQNFGAELRYNVFEKIMKFSEISSDNFESGSLITRITNDTSQIIQFVNRMMRIFIKAPIICIGSIILSVILSPKMSTVLFISISIITILILISMNLSYKRFIQVQYAIDKINTIIQEYLMGIKLVKAFGRYQDEEKKFESANDDLTNKSIKSQLIIVLFQPLMSLSISLGIAIILYWGSILFKNGEIEVGKVAAFINYMMQILNSLIMMTNIFHAFVRTKASNNRIVEILNSDEDNINYSKQVQNKIGNLEFDNATFAYPRGSGIPAIKNLTFKVSSGETLAIIGPTGSGKSTIAWLCLRFYDIKRGAIKLNDININTMDIHTLRNYISISPQKSMLFSGSIYNNISWSNPKASEEQVINAAKITQAHKFINTMPNKYNTILGQNGANLSGGQKQRISLARALLKDSPILILDDCTSALDSVTEAKVRGELKNIGNKTIILITQRISTAMFADNILVLDNGETMGLGSHKELLDSCKTYQDIFESQIGNNMNWR
ncbi:MAG: ABC transporter ATP-binding protein [Eubacteriaceae bacterium]